MSICYNIQTGTVHFMSMLMYFKIYFFRIMFLVKLFLVVTLCNQNLNPLSFLDDKCFVYEKKKWIMLFSLFLDLCNVYTVQKLGKTLKCWCACRNNVFSVEIFGGFFKLNWRYKKMFPTALFKNPKEMWRKIYNHWPKLTVYSYICSRL